MFPNWVFVSLALLNHIALSLSPKRQKQPGLALEFTGFFVRAFLDWGRGGRVREKRQEEPRGEGKAGKPTCLNSL